MNLTDIGNFFSYLINTIGPFIIKIFKLILDFIKTHGNQIESTIMYVANLLGNILKKIVDTIKSLFNKNSDNKNTS